MKRLLHRIDIILANDKAMFWLSILAIILYYLPYLILGSNSHLLIHDNLDANVSWIKSLISHGQLLARPTETIDQVMNGVPRSSVYGSYDLSLLVFKLMGIFPGYVANKFLMSIVGFIGMNLLLKRHVLMKCQFNFVVVGSSLAFALLPFTSFTMSVAGIPLALFALLNLRKGKAHWTDWIIIVFFPFCSSLVLSGIFLMGLIGGIFIADLLRFGKANWLLFVGTALMGLVYLLSHFPVLYSFFFNPLYVSHRTEFFDAGLPFKQALNDAFDLFLYGQYHVPSIHFYVIFLVIIVSFFIKDKRLLKISFYIALFLVITSIFYGIWFWNSAAGFKEIIMSFLPMQLQRFHYLHPTLWYILFAIALSIIAEKGSYGKYLALILLGCQFIFIVKKHELIANRHLPTFKQYFSEDQFDAVRRFINKPQANYRILDVGIDPSVSLYNGFYTLDGYLGDYPISYKHEFRKIIINELSKDITLKKYFDNWGSRCYTFSNELWQNKDKIKKSGYPIRALNLNFGQAKKMGAKYIFSKGEIKSPEITLLKIFDEKSDLDIIYLYLVN